jgi:YD repeat-containing protein
MHAQTDLGQGRAGDLLYVHHAPDPINTRTGNFFLPLQDYYLSCYAFPLEVYRSYNSFSTRNGPFGDKWTFNYDVQIIVGQSRTLKVIESDGFENEYVPIEGQGQSKAEAIATIVQKRKQEDITYSKNPQGKGDAFYTALQKRLMTDDAYFEKQKQRYVVASAVSTSGKYVSNARGTSYLTQTGNGFIRENDNGWKETYNAKGYLTRIEDRNGNYLNFGYDAKSRLARISDACSHSLFLTYNAFDKIASIRDSFQRKIEYTYDKNLRLISFKGLDQQTMRYEYDANGWMTNVQFEDGTSTAIGYAQNGQVVSQIGPGKKRSTFSYKSKGPVDITTITNNGETQTYAYNDAEGSIVHTDANGVRTTTVLSACCGKPISIQSTNGIDDVFEYDAKGRLLSRTNAKGQTTTFAYEPRFGSISTIEQPDGQVIRYRYDANANIIFAQISQSDTQKASRKGLTKRNVKIDYEAHGKMKKIQDQAGNVIYFTYSDMGKVASIDKHVRGKSTAKILYTYDPLGQTDQIRLYPNQPTTPTEIKTTLLGYMELLAPAGIDFEL